jgi:hypothetical protein
MDNEEQKLREFCDEMLFALVGSEELAEKWWTSHNKAFDKTPNEQWKEEPGIVFDYLGFHAFGR